MPVYIQYEIYKAGKIVSTGAGRFRDMRHAMENIIKWNRMAGDWCYAPIDTITEEDYNKLRKAGISTHDFISQGF